MAGFVRGFWLCDLCSQFRLIYLITLLPLSLILLFLRAKITAVLCFVMWAINAYPVILMLAPVDIRAPEHPQNAISILNFNTEFEHNSHYELFAKVLQERNPQILALIEIDHKWIENLTEKTKIFAYNKIVIEGPGIALFSKYPIVKCEVRHFGRSHHPRILATILVKKKPVFLMLAHPITPQSDSGYRERNQELALVAEEIKSENCSTKLLIGDLNCGPWSPEFQALTQSAELTDSEQGFGPQPSWPARNGRLYESLSVPPMIPIDHVLGGSDIRVLQRIAGPPLQSDHLPVFVQYCFGP